MSLDKVVAGAAEAVADIRAGSSLAVGGFGLSGIASAVKPELVLDPKPAADGSGSTVEYGFVLDPARA